MNTFKNFIKQYFFMLALVGIAVGFSAFKASNTALEEFYWYEVNDATGEITDNQIDPNILCGGELTLCAVGFSEDHYPTVGPDEPAPLDNISQLSGEDPAGYSIEMKN